MADVEGSDDEDEDTDDEDSDDDDRERFEEKLRIMEDTSLEGVDAKALQAPHLVSAARQVPYQLVIPTYQRWQPVNEMTKKRRFKKCRQPFILAHSLAFLSRQGIPKFRVTLFVADRKELEHYRKALKGTEWENVKIEISVLGNRNSRNFIMRHFPANTYVVSLDDDVEMISWKVREGMTDHVLRAVPPGGFEKIIYDAYRLMKQKRAFIWGVNTSQNSRHMGTYGISSRNGLVNGYLCGYISRPQCEELYRQVADATEDSEFAVRHYAKDGIVIRYRMYAGITSPYMNRGGLQKKFEAKGERITAEQRSMSRKKEERCAAMELHRLFPNLIGPPKERRDKKTMEVNFYSHGYLPGQSRLKRIAPTLLDKDRIRYRQDNPKQHGSHAHSLYEQYKRAKTLAEARDLGARPIDFAHDYNWGFMSVVGLSATVPWEVEVVDGGSHGGTSSVAIASSEEKSIKVRVKEMSIGHRGLDVPRESLLKLAARAPQLRRLRDDQWAGDDGPFAAMPLGVLRSLLRWAATGHLRYERKCTRAVHDALKACGNPRTAKLVKKREAEEAEEKGSQLKAVLGVSAAKQCHALRVNVSQQVAVKRQSLPKRRRASYRKPSGKLSGKQRASFAQRVIRSGAKRATKKT